MMTVWRPWQHVVGHAIVITSKREPGQSTTVFTSSNKLGWETVFYNWFHELYRAKCTTRVAYYKTISSHLNNRSGWCHTTTTNNTIMLWIRLSKQAQNCSCVTFWVWACYTDVCIVLLSVYLSLIPCIQPTHTVWLHSVTFLWVTFSFEETPVGQTSTTHTAQYETLLQHNSAWAPWVKENIYHNQPFSFAGSTENITGHCGYLRSLKISQRDNSPCIRWQAALFSLSLLHQNCRFLPMPGPIIVCFKQYTTFGSKKQLPDVSCVLFLNIKGYSYLKSFRNVPIFCTVLFLTENITFF